MAAYYFLSISFLRHGCLWANRFPLSDLVMFCLGHGRSVCVMCALLVALGVAEDWRRAEKLIRERRPYIRMNALHRKSLEEWSKHRLSSPKRNEEMDVSSVIRSNTSGSESDRSEKKSK